MSSVPENWVKKHPVRDFSAPQTAQDIDDNFDRIFVGLRELSKAINDTAAALAGGGLDGEDGKTVRGPRGDDGERGSKGVPGSRGKQGLKGKQGVPGHSGADGDTGSIRQLTTDSRYLRRAGIYNAGDSGTALTLDWNNGSTQYITLTGNVTLTLNNPRDNGKYTLIFNTGAGSFTVTFPAGAVYWPAATAPTITTTAARYDLVTLVYSTILGKYLGAFSLNHF